MSRGRKKGAGKTAFKELIPILKWEEARYGKDHRILAYVQHWRRLFECGKQATEAEKRIFVTTPKPKKETAFVLGHNSPLAYHVIEQTKTLLFQMQTAIEKNDGSVFRKIADAIESLKRIDETPVDPLRAYLAVAFFEFDDFTTGKQTRKITHRDLKAELIARKIACDDTTIRDACNEMGIVLKAAKSPGRPRKK